MLGLALGAGLAAVAVAIVESTDSTVRSARDLPELPGVPMLATIPVILNKADRRRRRMVFGSYAAVLSMCAVVVGLTVVAAFHR